MKFEHQKVSWRTSCERLMGFVLLGICASMSFGQPASGIKGVVADNARPELVQEGFRFTEGPVGTADGGLYFSDIMGADKTYRLEPGGKISVYRSGTNGRSEERRVGKECRSGWGP